MNLSFPMRTQTLFSILSLDSGETYLLRAVPMHKSGDFIQNPDRNVVKFSTRCKEDDFVDVNAVINEKFTLLVEWKVTSSVLFPCARLNYDVEISAPELAEPVVIAVGPNETQKTLERVFLKEGFVRVKSVGRTNLTSWSRKVRFQQDFLMEEGDDYDDLKILDVSATSSDFLWKGVLGTSEATLVCNSSVILCFGSRMGKIAKRVQRGSFTIADLTPFTKYSCQLENTPLTVSFTTDPDVPSTPPREGKLWLVTNTSASIIFTEDISCSDLNGALEAFTVELWSGDQLKQTSTISRADFSPSIYDLENLAPDTYYVAKVFIVNMVGRNPEKFTSIPFKTKSKAPDAVKDLLVYKRTRNALWLRWMKPENDHGSIRYKVNLSSPGVPTKTEELSPTKCEIWPDFVCHRVRGLVSDVEYTVTIEPLWAAHRGPPTSTKALTRESDPDAPEDVHVVNYTMDSIMLSWKIPLMLNSDPKFFHVTLDQIDEYSSTEKSSESVQQNIHINEDERAYELELTDLNPATTYAITVTAGNRGKRASLNVNTPPKKPPAPPTPLTAASSSINDVHIIVRGLGQNNTLGGLLSGYLVMLSINTTSSGIHDKILADSLRRQFGEEFVIVEELPPALEEESIQIPTISPRKTKLSEIESVSLKSGVDYRVAVAAVSTYCGAHSASVSKATTVSSP